MFKKLYKSICPASMLFLVLLSPTYAIDNKKFAVDEKRNFACVLDKTGEIWCWYGDKLRYHFTEHKYIKMTASSGAYSKFKSGHVCAIDTENNLYCMGTDEMGETGKESPRDYNEDPIQIPGKWQDVSTLGNNTCAIKTDGTIWCWGKQEDHNGLLGKIKGNSSIPIKIDNNSDYTRLTLTGQNQWPKLYALRSNGQLMTNIKGNANNPEKKPKLPSDQLQPIYLLGKVIDFDTSSGHGCALLDTGDIQCWGYIGGGSLEKIGYPMQKLNKLCNRRKYGSKNYGCPSYLDQFGKHFLVDFSQVKEKPNFVSIDVSGDMSCAVTQNGERWCWGEVGRFYDSQDMPKKAEDMAKPRKIDIVENENDYIMIDITHGGQGFPIDWYDSAFIMGKNADLWQIHSIRNDKYSKSQNKDKKVEKVIIDYKNFPMEE